MFRRAGILVVVFGLLFGAGLVHAQDIQVPVPGEKHAFGDPRPVEGQAHSGGGATQKPDWSGKTDTGAPPVEGNSTPGRLDARSVAVYSVLWILAIVLAMTAILRAEATDRYHEHTHGDVKA
jgi:hypothetical protein